MKNKSTKGILYPQQYKAETKTDIICKLPQILVLPHKSWNLVQKELEKAFEKVRTAEPSNIFVFSILKNGKIGFDDPFIIYTDSDCEIENPVLVKNDDVCSEEYSAEILQPFFENLFPKAKVNQFLTTEENEQNKVFFERLWKDYPCALFIISRNDSEVPVWPEHLQG